MLRDGGGGVGQGEGGQLLKIVQTGFPHRPAEGWKRGLRDDSENEAVVLLRWESWGGSRCGSSP